MSQKPEAGGKLCSHLFHGNPQRSGAETPQQSWELTAERNSAEGRCSGGKVPELQLSVARSGGNSQSIRGISPHI